ncbi:hypothetical protein [Sinorhizobium americanum]|uniref:Transmembrane protein n=1 Tax=Sinorhizobium americanum TaxID=194963 RepID=A0A4R2BRL8_9HYPH|nr:hypothetical protein [Sinorhizobium americanum]TCN30358.1 hypothetical protein EV184_108232 [Sinorhizobium americanum]
MKLVPDAGRVLRYAWSIRLMILAAVLSGLEVALPLLDGLLPIPAGVFAALSGLTVGGAFVTRLLAQKEFSDE